MLCSVLTERSRSNLRSLACASTDSASLDYLHYAFGGILRHAEKEATLAQSGTIIAIITPHSKFPYFY